MRLIFILLLGCNDKKDNKAEAVISEKLDEPKSVFDGNSQKLKNTEIVAVLNSKIRPGNNLIWCSTLISAWKEINKNITKEAPLLLEESRLVDSLNLAPDPASYIPDEIMFANSGLVKEGIIEKIRDGLAKKFSKKGMPDLAPSTPESFIAYAYLKTGINFNNPYHINDEAFEFQASSGIVSKVKTFGVIDSDSFSYDLADQIGPLYAKGSGKNKQFIVDLDNTSKKLQILLARIKPQESLGAAVAYINEKLETELSRIFSLGDTLIVPQTVWKINHIYNELNGKKFKTDPISGHSIFRVEQSIEFKLHSKGVEVESEAVLATKSAFDGTPVFDGHYNFDKPFYILMRKRGEKQPFFVMYVDNAELLSKWE